MSEAIKQASSLLAEYIVRRAELQWAIGDILKQARRHSKQGLQIILAELKEQHGLTLSGGKPSKRKEGVPGLQTAKNYADVALAFGEGDRHLHLKWSYFLECAKHEDPIKAMEFALDNGYSPTQMSRLRRYGDPEYKPDKVCGDCGKPLPSAPDVCRHCRGREQVKRAIELRSTLGKTADEIVDELLEIFGDEARG